jgi:hypothetical protein
VPWVRGGWPVRSQGAKVAQGRDDGLASQRTAARAQRPLDAAPGLDCKAAAVGQLLGAGLGVTPVVKRDDAERPSSGRERENPVGTGQEVWVMLTLIAVAALDMDAPATRENQLSPGQRRAVAAADHALEPLALLEPGIENLIPCVGGNTGDLTGR